MFRHAPDQPAGRLEEIRVDGKGLYVRARVSHAEAKRCPYFSVAATVHAWRICQADDREHFHGLVTSATLDEVSLVPTSPGNPAAVVQRAPAVAEFYDIAKAGFNKCIEIVEVLQKLAREQTDVSHVKHHRLEDRSTLTLGPAAGHIYGPIPARPVRHARPPTQFSALVQRMQEM